MTSPVAQAPNRSYAFSTTLFEELARAGVREVCICPGSRSTPLVVAAVRNASLRCWSHIDERSAAFFALGLAKTKREPVVLLCTSGTAAANFLPAVIEANYAQVPLIVLTADRPAELREWGAGQTINQVHLYGSHVRWFAETPLPEASASLLRYARAMACRAVAQARGRPAGPVHLNLPFREPLEPTFVPADQDLEASVDGLASEGRDPEAYLRVHASPTTAFPEDVANLAEAARRGRRGVIVAGPLDADTDLHESLLRLQAATGWPLIAEPTSQLRAGNEACLAHSDLLLRDPEFAKAHAPELVLRFGATPTSKSLRLWLELQPPEHYVLVDPDAAWNEPSHLASLMLRVDPAAFCEAVVKRLNGSAATGRDWLGSFQAADRAAAAAIDAQLSTRDELSEPQVVRDLAESLPGDSLLYVSNSMPVRDLDAFLPASPRSLRVLCNRGANGIDGITSSALGAAAGHGGPVVLLTGDLAFLHDLGGLSAARRHDLHATLVVLDNGGGGIFSFLPVADYGDSVGFEEHFRTPHGLDLCALSQAFGLDSVRVSSREHLRAALKDAIGASRTSVIHVPIDRDRNVALHREIQAAVSTALREVGQ